MVVTSILRHLRIFSILALGMFQINCSVNQESPNVPNAAFNCQPTQADIDNFKSTAETNLISCASCHDGSNGPPFLISAALGAGNGTFEQNKENLCAVYRRGQLMPTNPIIFNYAQDPEHEGATPAADMPLLKSWLETFTLEEE